MFALLADRLLLDCTDAPVAWIYGLHTTHKKRQTGQDQGGNSSCALGALGGNEIGPDHRERGDAEGGAAFKSSVSQKDQQYGKAKNKVRVQPF